MVMWNEHHEPGPKYLLNGYVVPDRNPVDGMADFEDAIDNVFNHQNVPPFVSTFLIQRLVTANPSPAYVTRVASVFADNGQGVRGDLTAVLKAILLDNEAKDCAFADVGTYGSLKEPFLRYMQINKAFHATTLSGNYRNDMRTVLEYVDQRPLSGQLTDLSLGVIERMINQLDDDDEDDMLRRVHVAIYLVMTSPEYLINK